MFSLPLKTESPDSSQNLINPTCSVVPGHTYHFHVSQLTYLSQTLKMLDKKKEEY